MTNDDHPLVSQLRHGALHHPEGNAELLGQHALGRQLLHVYLRPDLPKDHSHGYWCAVVRGRYLDEVQLRGRGRFDFGAEWVADHGGGYVDAAYLDNESGEITW